VREPFREWMRELHCASARAAWIIYESCWRCQNGEAKVSRLSEAVFWDRLVSIIVWLGRFGNVGVITWWLLLIFAHQGSMCAFVRKTFACVSCVFLVLVCIGSTLLLSLLLLTLAAGCFGMWAFSTRFTFCLLLVCLVKNRDVRVCVTDIYLIKG